MMEFYVTDDFLNDPKLSFKAKGLYAFLQSRPKNWKISLERLMEFARDGREAIRSGLKELEDRGYLKKEVSFDEETGRFDGYTYVLRSWE